MKRLYFTIAAVVCSLTILSVAFAQTDVANFNVKGLKLGMTIEEIKGVSPELKIEKPKTTSSSITPPPYIPVGKIGLVSKVAYLHARINNNIEEQYTVYIAEDKFGRGAFEILYILSSYAHLGDLTAIKDSAIKKYGNPTYEKPTYRNLRSKRTKERKETLTEYYACYGECSPKQCGNKLEVNLSRNGIRLSLLNSCIEANFKQSQKVKESDIRF